MSAADTAAFRRSASREAVLLVVTSLIAAVLHVVALIVLALAPTVSAWLFPDDGGPPEEIIEVALVSLPQTDAKMAQMDVAPPAPEAPVDPDAPAPDQDPGLADQGTAEPTPETASDLVIHDEAAEEAQGDPDRDQREARRRELLRRARLNALRDAPEGTQASTAGDPDSTSSERIDLGGSGLIADPELARYIQAVRQRFLSGFNPLPTIAQQDPDVEALIQVRFDVDTGRVTSWSWVQRSSNPSWDAAAERAVEAVTTLPVPPEAHKGRFEGVGTIMRFNAASSR